MSRAGAAILRQSGGAIRIGGKIISLEEII
nr:MAG TPA: hypothetical protein [Caudoviricetes sp.]